MEPVVRVRIKVRGRVQGVWFRGSTREQALGLGLSGWVRNMMDGSVELEAEGARGAVDRLVQWCGHGPSVARVDSIEVDDIDPQGMSGAFEVRR